MQNVYDLAHELVRSLKETDQYKDYMDAPKALKENEQVYAMMNDFQQKSMEFQTKTMMGEPPDQEAAAEAEAEAEEDAIREIRWHLRISTPRCSF